MRGEPDPSYCNDEKSYKDLCDILTRARLEGKIPFDAIADPTRTVCSWDCYRDIGAFVGKQMEGFLKSNLSNQDARNP